MHKKAQIPTGMQIYGVPDVEALDVSVIFQWLGGGLVASRKKSVLREALTNEALIAESDGCLF